MHKTSLLVPFRSDYGDRGRLWDWLNKYWENVFPEAEIVVGGDVGSPFSKTTAVNDAFSRSTGDIVVILDADAYLKAEVIRHCADRLRNARRHGARTWFVPYEHMYRLSLATTAQVLAFEPGKAYWPQNQIESMDASGGTPEFANRYGALIQIMPREAFELVGQMDSRFRGWGGEDVSFLRALDTLWGKHKNIPTEVFHLWHPKFAGDNQFARMWQDQALSGPNNGLALRYRQATWDPQRMRHLIED